MYRLCALIRHNDTTRALKFRPFSPINSWARSCREQEARELAQRAAIRKEVKFARAQIVAYNYNPHTSRESVARPIIFPQPSFKCKSRFGLYHIYHIHSRDSFEASVISARPAKAFDMRS